MHFIFSWKLLLIKLAISSNINYVVDDRFINVPSAVPQRALQLRLRAHSIDKYARIV
jgi:hypothetical protein